MLPIRRRVAAELAVLATGAALYLVLLPERPLAVDVGLGLVGLGLVAASARDTRERIWGRPTAPGRERFRLSALRMVLFSGPAVLLFGAYAAAAAGRHPADVVARLFPATLFADLILFVPWALVQQVLFQFYLLGRLKSLLPGSSAVGACSMNGVLFGAMHVPDWDIVLVTVVAGAVWSCSYYRDRCLLPISLSHAVLGTTYFHWVRGEQVVMGLFGCR